MFWRLLHRMEAKTKSGTFLAESCGRALTPPQPPTTQKYHFFDAARKSYLFDNFSLPILSQGKLCYWPTIGMLNTFFCSFLFNNLFNIYYTLNTESTYNQSIPWMVSVQNEALQTLFQCTSAYSALGKDYSEILFQKMKRWS